MKALISGSNGLIGSAFLEKYSYYNEFIIRDSNWAHLFSLEEGLRHCYRKLLSRST